ncbi:hypothetical protein BKA91DRAFT_129429 [Yarrowia lipolytica]|nr:hypothetical protein BKA91DRAFT_129429 [Yarrowia lipolytica]KAE8170703.1 hypothetical protein BKA90DRAFT_130415 [Yarrowia lipolytica]RMI97272.1 hypothetical protein BD777DRAFT_135847 [Yarrowia lipolytica]
MFSMFFMFSMFPLFLSLKQTGSSLVSRNPEQTFSEALLSSFPYLVELAQHQRTGRNGASGYGEGVLLKASWRWSNVDELGDNYLGVEMDSQFPAKNRNWKLLDSSR